MAAGGHFEKKFKKKKSCVLIWDGEKCDQTWFSVIKNGCRRPFWKKNQKKKLCIDLKWWEMWSKVIFGHPKWPFCEKKLPNFFFGHPKWPPAAILWKQIQVAYWSEMGRNAIKSDFRSSKMAAGSHFVNKKIKVAYWSENGEKCDRKWFSVIQNGRRQPFYEKIYLKKSKLRIDQIWREMWSKAIFGHPK